MNSAGGALAAPISSYGAPSGSVGHDSGGVGGYAGGGGSSGGYGGGTGGGGGSATFMYQVYPSMVSSTHSLISKFIFG